MVLDTSMVAYANQQSEDIKFYTVSEKQTKISVSFLGKGKGTSDNPYQITTAKQLDEVRKNLAAHYELKNEIDLSSFHNWIPIGDSEHPFTGSFDGNGFTIKNLKINSIGSDYAGLFGNCLYASFRNINLIDVSIDIDKKDVDYTKNWKELKPIYVGAIAARANNFENCSVDGNICVSNCSDAMVGGVVAFGKNINKCISKMEIYVLSNKDSRCENDSTVCCGGIVGKAAAVFGEISQCINYGNIDGISGTFMYCGGISGEYGKISECINYGNTKGKTINYVLYSSFSGNCNVGGIVGATAAETLNSINYGNIYGYALKCGTCYAGGIAGYNGYYSDGEVKNCINFCSSIMSIGQLEKNEQYIDTFNAAGRIAGGIGTYRSNPIQNSYAVNTTLVNGQIPIENIGLNSINGESLSKVELEQKMKEITNLPNSTVDMQQCKVTLLKEKYIYTGKVIKPTPTVTYKNKELKNGKDYELSYKNNKEIGIATILVKGKGNYSGSIEIEFRIISKEEAKAEKKVEEISTQYNEVEKQVREKSQTLFKNLKNENAKVKKSIKKKIKENQLTRPLSVSGKFLPKEAYNDFLKCYYEKIDDAIESNFTSYKDVKTTADLVNKISGELVSEDGKFTFTSMGQTYTCTYKKVGGWGALWTPGKIVNEKTKVTYIWQAAQISTSNIQNEMKYLKEYADSKIEEAKNQCILEGEKALQVNKLKSFLGKMLSNKSIKILNGVSPDIVLYAKWLKKATEKYIKLKKAYSNIVNFDLSDTNYDKLISKINNFNKLLKEWEDIVAKL